MRERMYKRGEFWWVRVRNRAGRIVRKSTKCRDYQAALIVAAEYERAAADPGHARSEETTIGRCVEDYFADLVRRGRSQATKEIAQQKCGHFIRLWGKSMAMARLDARLVTEYIDTRKGEGVVPFTIKKELGHLHQILTIARHHGAFHLAPEQVLPPYFSGEHKPRKRWLTPVELTLLLEQLPTHRAAHVLFIVGTGARRAESFRAQREDVDFENRIVHVRGTKTEAADDDVAITKLTLPILEQALELAPGKHTLFLPWDNMVRDLKAACTRAGIAKGSANDLRRTFGKWHRLSGAELDLVATQLRHTTDKLAQTTYAKVSAKEIADLLDTQLSRVSNLYREEALEGSEDTHVRDENTENRRAPGRDRICDLRFRKPTTLSASERRSVGTKLGLLRKSSATSVPDLYADPWKARGSAFQEATANLALLLAGVR